jgi:acyl-CoA hydrolase
MTSLPATPKSTTVRMCHVISQGDLNECQGVSTGLLLRWMDICACLSAEKLAKTSCVTLQMDHLILNVPDGFVGGASAPNWLGCAIIVEASVVQVWGTSTEIVVRVFTDPHMQPITASRNLQQILLASAFFVFCGMKITDEGGKSVCPKMPAFALPSPAEKTAGQFADLRRKARLSKQAMIEKAQYAALAFHLRSVFVTFCACTASQSIKRPLPSSSHLSPAPALSHPSMAFQLANLFCSMCT